MNGRQNMKIERKRFVAALLPPVYLLVFMWLVKIFEILFKTDVGFLGVHPLSLDGLPGILLMPFIHGGWSHLMANTVPFLVLSTALFYFYREISWKVLIGIWLLSGMWVWFGGRPSWHIGASGVIYGLSAFLFLSGIIRDVKGLAALSLIVAFLYGSMIWGVFPDFFPKEKNISWEGHLGGLVSGVIMALYYRTQGPQRRKYSWELEDEEEEDPNPYWRSTHT
ncbi:MAG: rhomboid family intramembrane serine protease [Bacteroidetes bacterium CG18_big_fil_WC_8_21_14_2_50_41_14]|nr:MAG: rhomboid family intramembrane serine protease [Bacteroidetes bacterium CG18_big_fil_WC_8_21_14_2_50_41_14]